MTKRLNNSITFALVDDRAVAIVKRAAAALQLRVDTFADGTFCVHLNDPIDAYHLGDRCVTDPGWAGLFTYGHQKRGGAL